MKLATEREIEGWTWVGWLCPECGQYAAGRNEVTDDEACRRCDTLTKEVYWQGGL